MKCEFNWKRFGKYFLYDLKCMKRKVLPYFIMPVLIPIGLEILCRINIKGFFSPEVFGPALEVRRTFMIIATILMAVFCPARLYGELTEKVKGSEWLMLPASRGEKFFSMELITLLVLPVIFLTEYFFTDWLISLIDRSVGASLFTFEITDIPGATAPVIGKGIGYELTKTIVYLAIFLTGALLIKRPRWKIVGTILTILAVLFFAFVFIDNMSDYDWFFRMMKSITDPTKHAGMWAWVIGVIVVITGTGTVNWFKVKNMQH